MGESPTCQRWVIRAIGATLDGRECDCTDVVTCCVFVHARIVEGRSTLLSRCLDMQFERWPGGESVAVSHGLLRIGQAPLRVAVSTHTQDVFRLLLQMAEIRM
jgi:hypothetical protein